MTEPDSALVLMKPDEYGSKIISNFMFVLGFLIVFRANQAYARWFEGGTLLLKARGDFFQAYSSAVSMCTSRAELQDEVNQFRHQLLRLTSLLYGSSLVQLRADPHDFSYKTTTSSIEILGLEDFDQQHLEYLQVAHDKTETVMQWIQQAIIRAHGSGIIEAPPPILTRVYNQLSSGMDSTARTRKISEFVFPFPVAQLISSMLVIHWMLTAVICATSVATWWWAGTLAFLSMTAYWGIHFIAIELEMPFGNDVNDLPMEFLQKDMNASLVSMIHPYALTLPNFCTDMIKIDEQHHVQTLKHALEYDKEGRMVWRLLESEPQLIETTRVVLGKIESCERSTSFSHLQPVPKTRLNGKVGSSPRQKAQTHVLPGAQASESYDETLACLVEPNRWQPFVAPPTKDGTLPGADQLKNMNQEFQGILAL